ncbi:hypothetical protein DYB38_011160, partial [Aphanomyces astaci]
LTTPTDHGDHANVGALNQPKVVAAITEAFVQLPPYGVLSFANMIKRMCSMADKDGSGSVTAAKFAQVFDTLDIALPRASKTDHHPLLIQLLCDKDENVPYGVFCDLYVAAMSPPPAPTKQSEVDKESHKVLTEAFTEMQKMMVQKGVEFDYKSAFSLIDKGVITPPDLNEVLWAAGVRYPFSPEELMVLHRAFLKETGSFDADKFCDFAVRGPVVCAKVADEANSKVDAVIAHLQASIKQLVSNDKDATKFHKLFLDFDGNNDGTISTTEFLHILDHMGLSKGLTPAETDAILHFFDVNGDHAIDYTEFFHFANHADVMLQANVNASKGTVAVNASPPKATAGSAPSSPPKTTGSAPPSPSKSVTSTSKSPSKDNILALQHPNGQFTGLGKQLCRLASLDHTARGRGGFAFAKYFEKYKARHDPNVVACKKFRLILDKFLDTVAADHSGTSKQVAHDVARLDMTVIEKQYVVRETGMVKYPLFLRDVHTAMQLDARRAAWSDDDDQDDLDDDDDLSLSDSNISESGSSSDDSRDDAAVSAAALGSLLDRLLIKANWSTSKCSKCMRHLDEWFPPRASSRSRPKPFMAKLRDTVALPWRQSDLQAVAAACRSRPHRRVDPSMFVLAMREALARYGGLSNQNSTSPNSNSNNNGELKPLMAKIYHVFLQAAQRNINGRQLLERCDGRGSGAISWSEFSTVLRLMDCDLSVSELSGIQQALQSPSSCPYKSFFTLLETYGSISSSSSLVVASPRRHELAPPMTSPHHHLHHHALPPSSVHVALPPSYAAPNVYPTRGIEQELQAIFLDALRSVDSAALVAAFRAYDIKGCGFISLDGFHSAMRQGGIFLSPDIYAKIASQFAARFSPDGVDYVSFCHVMGLPMNHPPFVNGNPRKVTPLQLPDQRGGSGGGITPTAVESWLQHGASDDDKRQFNDMYNAIFDYKSKQQASAAQVGRTFRP